MKRNLLILEQFVDAFGNKIGLALVELTNPPILLPTLDSFTALKLLCAPIQA